MTIIDTHAHIYPDAIALKAAKSTGIFYDIPMCLDGTLGQLMAHGEAAGISRFLVHSVAVTPSRVHSINDYLMRVSAEHPDRLIGFGTLHPDYEDVPGELDRIKAGGLHGVKLHPDIQTFLLDDRRAVAMFRAMAERGLPALVHTGDYRYAYSQPERMAHVLDQVPDLKVICAHLGGWSVWNEAWRVLAEGGRLVIVDISKVREYAASLQTLAAAGGGRDGSELRSARIDWLVRNLETRLALGGRPAAALRYAATLHDIGTVAVPREMLTRDPHDLTPAQLRVIAAHAPAGAAVLGDIDFLEAAARVVRHHHERWDGRGYPDGLAGADIPLPARILGVIDAFEAVAWPAAESDPGRITEAVAEIRSRAGTQFDPDVVDALVSLFDESHWKSSPLSDQSEPFIDSAGEMWAGSRPRLRHAHPQVSDLLSRDVPPAGPRAAASTALGSTARGSTARGSTAIGEAPTPAGRAPRVPSRSTAWRRLVTWRDVESLVHRTRAHSERAIGGRLPVGRSWVIVVGASLVALVLLVLAAGFAARLQGPGPEQAAPVVMVVYFAVLVVAERFRLRIRGRLETAPTAAAVGIALALTAGLPGVPAIVLSTMQIAGVVLAAQLVDWVFVRRHLPGPERFDALVDAAIRGTTVILLSAIVRDVRWSGEPLLVTLGQRPGWWQALLLTTVVGLVLLLEVPPRAARRAETERARWRDTVGQELRDGFGLGTAMAGTGVLIAITETTLGLIAVPLLILPLAITQLAVRRYALTQLAYLQSVRALSRLPEIAGVVRAGHAERVASVAVALGRELHMREGEVRELEFAALLHDIGQVTLRRPIPFGATVLAAPADQDRIAEAGAGILEHSGTLDAVVEVVRYQAVPYHQVMGKRGWSQLASRVVKVANAYDDYLASDPDAHVADAVERLYLGLGHEFDPRVVRALESLTRRYGHDLAAPRASTPPQVTRQRTARA